VADKFYKEGLRFRCIRCSSCCRATPGFVFLAQEDLPGLTRATRCSSAEFLRLYCRSVSLNGFQRVSLKEKQNLDCIFWSGGGCAVYGDRPLQCRSFPFWAANLYSPEAWRECGASCPGVGRGRRHTRAAIEQWLGRQREAVFLEYP